MYLYLEFIVPNFYNSTLHQVFELFCNFRYPFLIHLNMRVCYNDTLELVDAHLQTIL